PHETCADFAHASRRVEERAQVCRLAPKRWQFVEVSRVEKLHVRAHGLRQPKRMSLAPPPPARQRYQCRGFRRKPEQWGLFLHQVFLGPRGGSKGVRRRNQNLGRFLTSARTWAKDVDCTSKIAVRGPVATRNIPLLGAQDTAIACPLHLCGVLV